MSEFRRYRGDGTVPPGKKPLSRGEPGSYLADEALVIAVNTALAVEQPLLVTGDPGTGKTALAWSIASELGLGDVLAFHTRSDHQARDALYRFDHLRRLHDAQVQDSSARDPENYVEYAELGQAIRAKEQRVVLIDEIDKAPRDFPNDLLDEIDQKAFRVAETGAAFKATAQPIVVITSNSERQLPNPFLRRCVFHHIEFPEGDRLLEILRERLGQQIEDGRVDDALLRAAIERFTVLRRELPLEKKPATSELRVWIQVLAEIGISAADLAGRSLAELPAPGALVKTRHDLEVLRSQRS